MLYPILLYPYITKDNFIVVLPPIAREWLRSAEKAA